MKNKATAGILALLLGGIGAHKFYLNESGLGILYLLFFWTGIPAVIALVEGVIYLTMSDDVFDVKYNQGYAALPGPTRRSPQQMAQNITVNIPSQDQRGGGFSTANMGGGGNIAAELEKLNELRIAGVLTDAEFQTQKQRLLNG